MSEVHFKKIIASFVVALIVYLLPFGLDGPAHLMLFVMFFVALLWITESAPLHATAIFAALLLILVVGIDSKVVFAQYFDPVVVLLLGGCAIAVAMSKHGLDKYIAHSILCKTGTNPKAVVFGIMLTTTFISMWISNTAAAAIVMPIALVIIADNHLKPGRSNFGKASVLAVAYGATIGGMGTIIGSTPNIIAAKFLNSSGISFGFIDWFIRGFPFMAILMILGWLVLVTLYKPEKKKVDVYSTCDRMTASQKKVSLIFMITIALWVTESIHGISSSVVAIIPIVLFYFVGLLNTNDFAKIDWATLILVGGGISLGMGIHSTGLDTSFASLISSAVAGRSVLLLFLMLGIFGVVMTTVVSNTAAASVYLPIVVALATTFGASPVNSVMIAALGVSLDFIFPFGTPPTAMAYGTKYVDMKDIAKAGLVISIIGIALLVSMGMFW